MSLKEYTKDRSQQKKIAMMSAITLLVLLAIFFFGTRDLRMKDQQALEVSLLDDAMNDEYYRDTDNDGAYDWEEALWPELDPENPDSDGDGVLDGAYIRQKKRSLQEEFSLSEGYRQSSQTEQFGRSIYTALLAAHSSGLDEEEQTRLISDNVSQYVSQLSLGGRTFLREDLHLVPTSYHYAKSYADAMKNLLARYPLRVEDLTLILSEVQEPSESVDVHTLALRYTSFLESLRDLEVPQAIAGRHTELVNTVSQLQAIAQNLTQTTPDDLVSFSFIVQVNSIAENLDFVLADIRTFIEFSQHPELFE